MKNLLITVLLRKTFVSQLLIIISCCPEVFAQNITYKTENKTSDLAPVKVSLSLLNFENIFSPITAGVLVEGHIKNKLFYNFQFRLGYLRNFMISKSALITSQKESKGTVIEAGVDFVFSDVVKPGKVKVVTSSTNYGTTTFQKYFLADCDIRKYWAVSGGIMEYIRPKYINSDSSEYIISDNTPIKAPGDKFAHFNQSTFGLYGGIVHRKIKKVVIKSDDWNYYRFYSTKFYAQILIGTTSIGNITYNDQSYKIDNAKQMPLGYRIGWQWDQMGVVTGFEFGKMPGVKLETPVQKTALTNIFSNNPFFNYLRLTVHFNIYNGDKKYHMKKS